MTQIVEVTTTVESEQAATTLARQIVTARLAACVQIDGPLLSIYRWKDEVCEAQEWRCTIKTLASSAPQLVHFINEAHPYDVPEILVIEVHSSSAAYAQWLAEQVDEAHDA
ncbi:MAG: divalent-cation tolerance protein CutA [Pirellulaceae bacterium]|nr:divalent-cation tolerance protein CutA [Pirellulaceae bacterium]